MDPLDDFEFKPLTEGLGFHRKKSSPAIKKTENLGLGLDLLDTEVNPLQPPLPRKKNTPIFPTEDSPRAEVQEIIQTLKQKQNSPSTPKLSNQLSKMTGKMIWKETLPSLSAGFLDTLLVLAATLLCFIVVLSVTKVDLIANWLNPDQDGWIILSSLALLALVTFVYLTVNRLFLGCTPGEWAHDCRIGRPEEQNTISFSLKVILRSLLIVVSGFIIFPLMSFIFKEDVAGEMSRIKIFKRGFDNPAET